MLLSAARLLEEGRSSFVVGGDDDYAAGPLSAQQARASEGSSAPVVSPRRDCWPQQREAEQTQTETETDCRW